MNEEVFMTHMRRLKGEWRNSYGDEKSRLFWKFLRNFSDEFMEDATDEFLANRRAAPVLQDFLDFADVFARRKAERSRNGHASIHSILDSKYRVADFSDSATRARVKGRIDLFQKYSKRKISKKQFVEGCDFYDRAAGLNPEEVISGMHNGGKAFREWSRD